MNTAHAGSIAQLCITPYNPIDCSPSGSSVLDIFLHLLHLLHWQAGSLPLHHLGNTTGVTQPKKRNEVVPSAETWMNLETVIQSEVSQNEKKQIFHIISLI